VTDTPSRRPGLRDELVAALGQIDIIPPVAHRRQQADNVLKLLYQEWPWLRAEAEDLAEARQHAAAIAAQRDRLRQRMHALADPWDHALAPDKAYARTLRAEISCAPFDPEGAMAVQEYTERGRRLWAFRCWGTDTCDGWLGLGHETQSSAKVEQERHVAEAHVEPGPAATQATDDPELTAQEARDLADELGTELYRAQDRLAFIAECCDAAEQDGTTTVDISRVRGWLDGPKCGMQLAAAEPGLYDKLTAMFSGPLPPPGDTPPSTVLGCSLNQLRRTHEPHLWQPQPGMRPVQCPGWEHVPAAADTPLAAAFRDCLDTFHGMRNSDGTGPVERWQARVTPREYETWQTAAQAAGQATAGVHVYLSTGCLHGDHAYCKSMTGLNGAKRPASCKKCGAKCICGCHQEQP